MLSSIDWFKVVIAFALRKKILYVFIAANWEVELGDRIAASSAFNFVMALSTLSSGVMCGTVM